MSARLFIGYFLALAACSTLAFAPAGPPPDALASGSPYAPQPYDPVQLPPFAVHRHKNVLQHVRLVPVQLAQIQ